MCEICGKRTTNITVNNINYTICSSCGFLSKTKEFIPSVTDEYNRYLLHDNDTNDGYIKYQENFYNSIEKFLGENVLDFGCGNNHILANIINENNINSSYFDIYFYPDESYKKSLYDAIIMEEVIEHLSDPVSVLKELISLLEENGKLIIKTMFIKEDTNLKNWWYLRDITHISFFSFETFSYLSKLLSLEIIYCNDKDLIILQKA